MEIKIFSWGYECGKYLLPFLFVLWLIWLICVIHLRRRKHFLCTSALFLLICMLGASFTWSGWHYRMELRDRYAVIPAKSPGWQEKESKKTYNINLMPAGIRKEYDKNGASPRLRDVILQVIWCLGLIPVTLLAQWSFWRIFFHRK